MTIPYKGFCNKHMGLEEEHRKSKIADLLLMATVVEDKKEHEPCR
jgi:hypothetical protein